MERCYCNSSPITVSYMKNVLLHQLNDVIRNEYELYAVYPKRANRVKIRVRILLDSPATTMY